MRILGEIFLYLGIVILGLLVGAIVVGVAGLLIGLLMARGYTKRGSSDPADGPVYVALGLAFFGALTGAIIGFTVSTVWCGVLAHRKRKPQSVLNGTPC